MKKREHYVTCGQMKLLEQRADEAGLSYYQMMENAGSRAAEFILCKAPFGGMSVEGSKAAAFANEALKVAEAEFMYNNDPVNKAYTGAGTEAKNVEISNILANNDTESLRDVHQTEGKTLAYVFCGKGNNGGDGFVVARLLSNAGWKVTVILVDGEPKTADSITNFGLLAELPIKILDMKVNDRALMELKETPDLIVDAIYGTGFKGKLKGNGLKAAIYINKIGKLTAAEMAEKETLIFALDIPSGLGGDMTRERDLDKAAVKANYTVTFHAKKPVHLQSFAAEYCGEILIADIGIDEETLMRVEIYEEE